MKTTRTVGDHSLGAVKEREGIAYSQAVARAIREEVVRPGSYPQR